MCMKMISLVQCQNPTDSIALRLSVDALSYSIRYASDELRCKRQVNHSKSVVFFFFFFFFVFFFLSLFVENNVCIFLAI